MLSNFYGLFNIFNKKTKNIRKFKMPIYKFKKVLTLKIENQESL